MLEEEVERLRGENRALVNSLLGTAGFPPVELPEAVRINGAGGFSRLRKRSWHQIQMQREKGAARETLLDGGERKNGPKSQN
jgi:hypothetical protein